MADQIFLEDGRALYGSGIGIAGMLKRISEHVSKRDVELSTWLLDKSNRGSPFCGFDIRALSPSHREAFWQAAHADLQRRIHEHGPPDTWDNNHFSGFCLIRLLDMRTSISNGEPPQALNDRPDAAPFNGEMEDLSELWFSDTKADPSP